MKPYESRSYWAKEYQAKADECRFYRDESARLWRLALLLATSTLVLPFLTFAIGFYWN